LKMDKIKIGVIGTGHLGRLHTKLLDEIELTELIGAYDIDEEKLNAITSEYGINAYSDIDDLLNDVDAVSVAATTSEHYNLVKRALNSGKHVLVEKPITSEIWQAEELVKLADEKNLRLQVGHIERFNPALVSLESYNLKPMFVQTDRLAQFNPRGTDVAVVLDLMIHDIDIILNLVGSKVYDIKASGVAVVSDTIDIANARIEFENGAVANVTASRISQKKMRKMRMFQRDKYISLDFITGVSEVFRLLSTDAERPENFLSFGEIGVGEKKKLIVYEQPEMRQLNALKHELELFAKAVSDGSQPVVSGKDGLQALKVAAEIIERIEESRIL